MSEYELGKWDLSELAKKANAVMVMVVDVTKSLLP